VKTRVRRFAVVHPVGKPPFKTRPELHYRDNRELADQLTQYARTIWPAPQQIAVDVHASHILVNGVHRASYSIHEHRSQP
jgi:hypothetical protein